MRPWFDFLIFGPPGPAAGLGSTGNGSGSKPSAGDARYQPPEAKTKDRSWALRVFGVNQNEEQLTDKP